MEYTFPVWILYAILIWQELWVAASDVNIIVKEEIPYYRWKTGNWGACGSSHCGDGGTRLRSVGCYQISGYQTLDDQCDNKTKPKSQKPCFKICDDHKNMVSWKETKWGECRPKDPDDPCEGTIVAGQETRIVQCHLLETMDLLEDEVCDYFVPKPATTRDCQFQCPQNCVVSEFGPWSSCMTCEDRVENRTHTRQVLTPPQHGGRDCPTLSEMEPCPQHDCEEKEEKYMYKVGPWRRCRQYKGKRHKNLIHPLGYQMRDVECINSEGIIVDKDECLNTIKTNVPKERRACAIPQECVVSNWTPWHTTNHSCLLNTGQRIPGYHWRTRTVMVLPVGNVPPCPILEEVVENRGEKAKALCKTYKWLSSEWSECKAQTKDPSDEGCNIGLKHRRAICVRVNDGVPVNSKYCLTPPPNQIETCELACSQTCLVSEWSEWSMCEPRKCVNERLVSIHRVRNDGSNAPDLSYDFHISKEENDVKGNRVRSRRVEGKPKNDSVQCPNLKESQSCFLPACFSWVLGEYGRCQAMELGAQCGPGEKHRTVHCYSHEQDDKVKDGMCLREVPKPRIKEPCYIPCEKDCVLSEWSAWTQCSKSCGSKRHPGQKRRFRSILAYPTDSGRECPKSRLAETEPCAAEFCSKYHWGTSPWEKCVPFDGDTCGPGNQIRQVMCYKGDKTVPEKRCYEKIRPEAEQNCTASCPFHCQLTKFGEWTPCPVTCISAEKKPYQFRERYILQKARHGGKPCPPPWQNIEERVCPGLKPCYKYRWGPTKWSGCVLPHRDLSCGNGVRTRALYCMRNDNVTLTIDECIKHGYEPLPVTQDCHISCDKLCDVSGWSDWSKCTSPCLGHRRRSRFMIGSSISDEKCRDRSKYPMIEKLPCECPKYVAQAVGKWSDCILRERKEDDAVIGHGIKGECGEGVRYKALMCKDVNGKKAEALECSDNVFQEEVCIFNCHKDCAMSPWSEWTSCTSTCGCGVQTRGRKMLEKAHVGGRKCPDLDSNKQEIQTRPCCSTPCENFVWVAEPWSPCNLGERFSMMRTQEFKCGTGTQERQVRCVNATITDSPEDVESRRCDHHSKPTQTAFCSIPCPGDCILSQWSEWSLCPQPCDILQSRSRHRSVLQLPKQNGPPCLIQNEIMPCILNQTCHEYRWEYTHWSSCLLPGNATCGHGKKVRHRQCVRHDGKIVSKEHCEALNDSRVVGLLEDACEVMCDVHCVVSLWTEWSDCSKDCGVAYQRRTRIILHKPEGRGRECPALLKQEKPCKVKMCYRWDVSPWSDCEVMKNTCGAGKRYRNITCRQDDDKEVSQDLCIQNRGRLQDSQQESACRVPCPGDCVTTRWSRWGECHRKCDRTEEEGIQTRSRAILSFPTNSGAECPTDLWESRPCEEGGCYRYSWHVSEWHNNTRVIWCERSDNIKAEASHVYPKPPLKNPSSEYSLGFSLALNTSTSPASRGNRRYIHNKYTRGCSDYLKPPTIKTCKPECTIPNTYCHDINECRCLEGFDAIVDEGVLRDCNMTVNASQKIQDGTEMLAIYYPPDDVTNFWMYAVIGAGSAFIIFVAIALYTMCRHFEKDRRQEQVSCRVEQSESTPSTTMTPAANNATIAHHQSHSKKVGPTLVHPLPHMTPSRIAKREEPKYRRDSSRQPFSQS